MPSLIEGIHQPFNTVKVVEADKDNEEVAEAEIDDEDVKVLQTVEAVEADDPEADAEDDEDV